MPEYWAESREVLVAGVHYSVDPGTPWKEPTTVALRKAIQSGLKARSRYSGAIDGIWGVLTIKGIQMSVLAAGFNGGSIDGIVGNKTCWGSVQYAYRASNFHSSLLFGGNTLPTTAMQKGANTVWEAFKLGLVKSGM